MNPLTTFGLLINSVGAAVERWLPGARTTAGDAELEAGEEEGDEPGNEAEAGAADRKLLRQARERLLRCLLRTALAVCVVLAEHPELRASGRLCRQHVAGMLSGIFLALLPAVRGELGRRSGAARGARRGV